MSEETFEEGEMAEYRNEQLDYKGVLMKQLNRIGYLMTRVTEEGIAQTIYYCVIGLEQFISPYLDKEYNEGRDALTEAYMSDNWELPGKFQRYIRTLPRWEGAPLTAQKQVKQHNFSLILLAMIQELMARKSLLLDQSTETKT